MQLVAYGAQDIYLSGNPQITFFKVVYRRHTNFAIEAIEQTFNGQADFGKKVTVTVSRNGDLITKVYLVVQLPEIVVEQGTNLAWTRNLGNIMIRQVEVEIGGQLIDRHYGEWLVIWSELTVPAGQQDGYAEMIGNTMAMFGVKVGGSQDDTLPAKELFIPLQFWFNRNYGLALPLIALQYHEVKLNVEFRPLAELLIQTDDEDAKVPLTQTVSMSSASLWIDYIYLDTDERRRFAQVSHEYLIEQLQFTGEETITGANNKIRLNFNHPCKEIVWVARLADAEDKCQWSNFTTGTTVNDDEYAGDNPMVDAKLQLNGHDRFRTRTARYFNLVQPYQHHTNVPATGIYVYSFGIKPEEHQPSGTANLSRIDNATFLMTFNPALFTGNETVFKTLKLLVYACNYNVLRVMSGITSCAQQLAAIIVAFQMIMDKQCKKCFELSNSSRYNQLVCF